MEKILVIIDGYNYYHKLDKYQKNNNVCVKWLNYKALIEPIISKVCNSYEMNNLDPRVEVSTQFFRNSKAYALHSYAVHDPRVGEFSRLNIFYFSAIANHFPLETRKRHNLYISELEKENIKIVLGEFKEKNVPRCKNCKNTNISATILKHEEKHTDVNIAITMLEWAFYNKFDRCYLLSEDDDFVPVVKRVKELFPSKRIIICPPPQKHYRVDSLMKASGENIYRIKWNQIKMSQFNKNNPWENFYSPENMEIIK